MPGEAHEDPQRGADAAIEHFAPTGGRVTGVVGLVLAAGILVLGVVRPAEVTAPVMVAAALGGLLAWTASLRPRVSASIETLYLRNMLSTVEVPLAAIDELRVRQVLAVRVGEKKLVSPGVGRKLRKLIKGAQPSPLFMPNLGGSMSDSGGPETQTASAAHSVDYVDHVEGRLLDLIEQARVRHGIERYSDESRALAAQVRRLPAWPEIGGFAVGIVAFAVTLVVG